MTEKTPTKGDEAVARLVWCKGLKSLVATHHVRFDYDGTENADLRKALILAYEAYEELHEAQRLVTHATRYLTDVIESEFPEFECEEGPSFD